MIAELVPAPASAHESFGAVPGAQLLPAEAALVADVIPARQEEFASVRHLARAAMRDLGHPHAPVLPGARREPLWPAGLVGSMTHCRGYRAAVLARSGDLAGVGIDAEPDEPLPPGLLGRIGLPEEAAQVVELSAARPGVCWDRLLFCAKEAVYKTWYPLVGSWLGFLDAQVEFDPQRPVFTVRLRKPGPTEAVGTLRVLHGGWRSAHGVLAAATTVPAPVPEGAVVQPV